MRLRPQARGNGKGIDCLFLPSDALIAAPVKVSMMEPADGDGEAVTDLAAHFGYIADRLPPTRWRVAIRTNSVAVRAPRRCPVVDDRTDWRRRSAIEREKDQYRWARKFLCV
jgi:hypothetical protein